MRKSISIIGCLGVPARYGGFETLAETLSLNLSEQFDIHVFCSKKAYSEQEQNQLWNNITRHFLNFSANGASSILYDLKSIIQAAKYSDIILILGGSAGIFFGLLRIFYPGKILVFHPDGMEWNRTKWNAATRFYLKLSIKTACRFSHRIIVDNLALLKNIHPKHHGKSCIIPYGGDQYHFNSNQGIKTDSYWLTIARAEPENNLKLVAECFKQVKSEKWILVSNYKDTVYGRKLIKTYKSFSNIVFMNKEYDQSKISDLYSGAKGFIHPHSAGGTNPSLVAAMWCERPLICHDNSFNRTTTANLAHYFTNYSDLYTLLSTHIISYNPSIKKLAVNNYSWQSIVKKYADLFNTLINQTG